MEGRTESKTRNDEMRRQELCEKKDCDDCDGVGDRVLENIFKFSDGQFLKKTILLRNTHRHSQKTKLRVSYVNESADVLQVVLVHGRIGCC